MEDRTVRILDDDNSPLIPPGSQVRVRRVDVGSLRPGAWVLVRRGGDFTVRRLLRHDSGASGPVVRLATWWGRQDPPMAACCVLGEVAEVQVGSRSFDPARTDRLSAWWDSLTEFRTRHPLQTLARKFL